DQRRDCHDSSRFHDHSFRPFHVIHAAIGTMPSFVPARLASARSTRPRHSSKSDCRNQSGSAEAVSATPIHALPLGEKAPSRAPPARCRGDGRTRAATRASAGCPTPPRRRRSGGSAIIAEHPVHRSIDGGGVFGLAWLTRAGSLDLREGPWCAL